MEPVHCCMSGSNGCFLTCIQVSQEAGKVVWYSYLFKNFPQFVVIHTDKDFSIVIEAEVDVLHQIDGHEFEQAPRVGDGQGTLECCSPWDCKELDTTEWLNWTELNWLTNCGAAHMMEILCLLTWKAKRRGINWSYEKKESEVAQSCLTLCGPMDCSLAGFSVHGIFQARVLEWGAIVFSGIIAVVGGIMASWNMPTSQSLEPVNVTLLLLFNH